MKKRDAFLIALAVIMTIAFFSLISLSSAAYNLRNYTIQKAYNGGEIIQGKINISFVNEPADGLFTSNFGGNLSLFEFLIKNGLSKVNNFNCSTINCVSAYSADGGIINSLVFSSGDKKAVGFKITGNEVTVASLKFTLSSNLDPSCYGELEINIANSTKKIQNYKYKNATCGEAFRGCFESSSSNDWTDIGAASFCEKIELPVAPAFLVGARIKNSTNGQANIEMELFDSEWNSVGVCILPKQTEQIQDLNCTIPHLNAENENEHYVCISLASASNANYQISTEDRSPVCGNSGKGFSNYVMDYDVFARALMFDSMNKTEINETSYQAMTRESLSSLVDNYVNEVYDGTCPDSKGGCIIPIEIYAKGAQTILFSNTEIKYNREGAPGTNKQDLYLLGKTNSLINSGYLNLDISKAEFKIPVASNQNRFNLYLNGTSQILSVPINITKSFEFDVTPKSVLVGIETLFLITGSTNISSASWDFGDEITSQSQGKTISHRYIKEGNYQLKIELTSINGTRAQRTFTIVVGDAKTAAETLIKKYENNLNNVSKQIQAYDFWIKNAINNKLNLSEINDSLQAIKKDYNDAFESEEYSRIVDELLLLSVPNQIRSSESGVLPLELGFNNLDISYLESLSDEDATSLTEKQRENAEANLINWNYNNYKTDVEYKIITISESDEANPLFTHLKIIISGKNNSGEDANLIIPYPKDEIIFKENYNERPLSSESSSAVYIQFSGSKTIEFLLPEKVEVSELGAYIAPTDIKELALGGDEPTPTPTNDKPSKAKWWYIALFLGFFIVYIALQEWYKRRYESFLFKNRDDLYNIINFIFNARISKMSDDEIRKRLEGFKWRSEQITYTFRKLDGKRTGMWEIPIFKFIENRKVKKEIAKRQEQNQASGSFIKSSY